jgi:hypothetical protein
MDLNFFFKPTCQRTRGFIPFIVSQRYNNLFNYQLLDIKKPIFFGDGFWLLLLTKHHTIAVRVNVSASVPPNSMIFKFFICSIMYFLLNICDFYKKSNIGKKFFILWKPCQPKF